MTKMHRAGSPDGPVRCAWALTCVGAFIHAPEDAPAELPAVGVATLELLGEREPLRGAQFELGAAKLKAVDAIAKQGQNQQDTSEGKQDGRAGPVSGVNTASTPAPEDPAPSRPMSSRRSRSPSGGHPLDGSAMRAWLAVGIGHAKPTLTLSGW
jgi:hypothetical protein